MLQPLLGTDSTNPSPASPCQAWQDTQHSHSHATTQRRLLFWDPYSTAWPKIHSVPQSGQVLQ